MLKDNQDAFGHGLHDYLNGKEGAEIIERDDGLVNPSGGPAVYFTPFKKWPSIEKRGIRYARGRVLDIGCGAGRVALYLQDKGLEVVGIDNSPLAIEVCKKRGVKDARLVPISKMNSSLGIFDTVIMYGGNFGLFGTPAKAKQLLKRLYKMTSKKGRIVVSSADTYATDDPDHLAYHAANRAKGRMSGQMRLRVRYRKYATPWFYWLIVSGEEMENILDGTGWKARKYLYSDIGRYIAVIDKQISRIHYPTEEIGK